MKAIWKFPLEYSQHNSLYIPRGAKILSCGIQNDQAVVWALVDPTAEKVIQVLKLFPTGQETDWLSNPNAEFIGTITFSNSFVYHVFNFGTEGR